MKLPNREELLARLEPYGQSHVLAFWNELNEPARIILARQIESVDLTLMARLGQELESQEDVGAIAARATSPWAIRADGSGEPMDATEARADGERALRAGQVGMVLVAGGQGTRLGFEHPKGMFPLGPISHRTLFQILIERLIAVARRYSARIPLYLMTSEATHEETVAYLQAHGRFGLPADDLHIFCQGTMPAVDKVSGRLLLSDRGSLALSPDGHGGMLGALARSGGLEVMQARGIERLFYCQVDNPLCPVCDPWLLGCHGVKRSQMTTLVVSKRDPLEKVGNVVAVDGRTRIIEYSDLPEAEARRTSGDGLVMWAANLAIHVFDVAFLNGVLHEADGLPFHVAVKKTPFVDSAGQIVEPDTPNSKKFERFVFDLLAVAERALVVEGNRADCFAPVKNASGAASDTPETAQQAMLAQHATWLRGAGARIDPGVAVEINPLYALDAAELAAKVEPGLTVHSDTYFG